MSNYYWYEPEASVESPAPDIVSYPLDSSYDGMFEDRIRAHPEYLQLETVYHHLHSMINNSSFRSLQDTITEELRNIVDLLFFLRLAYDTQYYTGDEDDFNLKVGNVLETLNYNAPLFFTKYVNSDEADSRDKDRERDWLRQLINSIYLQRKWAGSLLGYKLLPKLVSRLGAVYLRAQYISEGNFTVFSDKYFRLMKEDSFKRIVPGGATSVWPNSGHVEGSEDYSQVDISYFKWDTSHTVDEEISLGTPLKWDSGLIIGNEGKGLLIDITIDRLLYHTNSLGGSLCIMDNFWIYCMEHLLKNVRRGSDKIMLGSQLSLVASNDGRYTQVAHPTPPPGGFVPGTSLYDQEQQASFSHPNIQAKFQIFPQNWENNKEVAVVKLGSGALDSSVFVDASGNPLDPGYVVPTDIAEPLFETAVGQYERTINGGYQVVTTTIHKGVFSKKVLSSPLNLGGSNTAEADVALSTISVPHNSIAKGSSVFLFKISADPNPVYDRYVQVTDYFVAQTQQYDTKISLFKKNSDGAFTPTTTRLLVNYFNDDTYSTDTDYLEWASDDVIKLLPIVDHPKSTGGVAYSYIDYDQGRIQLRVKVSPQSLLAEAIPNNQIIDCVVECSYSINAIQKNNQDGNRLQADSASNLVQATEVGVFNSLGDIVAYGTFPPIIYDADKYHLSLNLLLQI